MLIKRLKDAFLGTVDILAEGAAKSAAVDYLIKNKIGYEIIENGDALVLRIREIDERRHAREFSKIGCRVAVRHGLPRFLSRYRRRYGFMAGAIVFAALVFFSQRVVWKIDVVGCESVSEESVVRNLEELAFTYGTVIGNTDFDTLHNDYLRLYDDLAWISVNMNGTWATVEVKELAEGREEDEEAIMNVVASERGEVKMIEAHGGKVAVKVGDKVAEGDLLISGVISYAEKDTRLEEARGRVMAEVERTFTLEVPKMKEEKVYIGEVYTEKSLVFFKKTIKLSRNYRISHYKYDKIDKINRVNLFGTIPLPVFMAETEYREYESNLTPTSYEEAEAEFSRLYPEALEKTLDGAEIVSVSYTERESDDAYIRDYTVVCVADIATMKKIVVS